MGKGLDSILSYLPSLPPSPNKLTTLKSQGMEIPGLGQNIPKWFYVQCPVHTSAWETFWMIPCFSGCVRCSA